MPEKQSYSVMNSGVNASYPALSLMEEVSLNDAGEGESVSQGDNFPMVHGRQSSVIDLSGRCSEIIVHELEDSDSDAGSEDVELLPHRYAASSDNCGGHLYVNRLSLATELLRTREPLPYDEDLKLGESQSEPEDVRTKGNCCFDATGFGSSEKHKPQFGEVENGHASRKESDAEPMKLHAPGGSFCVREISPLLTNNIQQCPCVII